MGSTDYYSKCPYCGFEIQTRKESDRYETTFCPMCHFHEYEIGGTVWDWMRSHVSETQPELDDESEEFDEEVRKAADAYVVEEEGKPHTPTKKEIANATEMIRLSKIAHEAFNDTEYMDFMVFNEDITSHTDDFHDFITYLIKTLFLDDNRW